MRGNAGQYALDVAMWSFAYPALELLSVFGVVQPPTCGFARIAPCESFPCWLLFDPRAGWVSWLMDMLALPLLVILCINRCCSSSKGDKEKTATAASTQDVDTAQVSSSQ